MPKKKKFDASTIEGCEALLAESNRMMDECRKAIEPHQRNFDRAYKVRERVMEQLDKLKIASGPPTWDYLLQSGGSMAHHKAGEAALSAIGLFASGMLPATGQRVISISVNSDEDLDAKEAALNTVLPFIKPLKVEEFKFDNACYFSLFDYDCSEYASFSIILDKADDTWWVCGMRYHRGKRFKQFNTLRELLEYLKVNHPRDVEGPDRSDIYDFWS